jgi:hypothetical protein
VLVVVNIISCAFSGVFRHSAEDRQSAPNSAIYGEHFWFRLASGTVCPSTSCVLIYRKFSKTSCCTMIGIPTHVGDAQFFGVYFGRLRQKVEEHADDPRIRTGNWNRIVAN